MKNAYSIVYRVIAIWLFMVVVYQGYGQMPQYHTSFSTTVGTAVPLGGTPSNRVQVFYTPADFSPALLPSDKAISKIYFQASNNVPNAVLKDFEISLKHVSSSLSGFASADWETGMTLSLSSSDKSISVSAGQWIGFQLDQLFPLNELENLVIDMQHSGTGSLSLNSASIGSGNERRIIGSYKSTAGTGKDLFRYSVGFDVVPVQPNQPPIPPLVNFKINSNGDGDNDTLWKQSPGVLVNRSTYADFNYWNITGYHPTSKTGPWLTYVPSVAVTYSPVIKDYYFTDTVRNKTNLYYTFRERGYYMVKLTSMNYYGISVVEKPVWIDTPYAKPGALFFMNQRVVGITEKAQFVNVSSNGPTSWNWWLDPPCWTCGLQKNEFFPGKNVSDPVLQAVDAGLYKVCLAVSNSKGSDTSCVPSGIRVLPGYEMCYNGVDTAAKDSQGFLYSLRGDVPPSYQTTACPQGFRIVPCGDTIHLELERLRLRSQDSLFIQTSMIANPKILRRYGGNKIQSLKHDSLKTVSYKGSELFVKFQPAFGPAVQVPDSGFAIRWRSSRPSYSKPVAGFTCPDTIYSGYQVVFENTSSGVNMTYAWDLDQDGIFGAENPDVAIDETSKSPSRVYDTQDKLVKEICLKSINCLGSDKFCKTITVLPVAIAPQVDFTVNQTEGQLIDTFIFLDKSLNGVRKRKWIFSPPDQVIYMGQTDERSEQPAVFFKSAQLYTVTLEAENDFGNGTLTKQSYVNVKTYSGAGSIIPPFGSSQDFGITRVVLEGTEGKIDTTSDLKPLDGSAYTPFHRYQKATLYRGGTYRIDVYRSTAKDSMNTRVWIDYNRNTTYEDIDETVFKENGQLKIKTTGEFRVPVSASIGTSRMLVGVSAGFSSMTSTVSTLGVYEDYSVTIGTDRIKPVVQLKGPAVFKVVLGKAFKDPGAIATDNIEGDISDSIKVSGGLNVNVLGYYEVKYYVHDYYGNVSDTVTRSVLVEIDQSGPEIVLQGPDTVFLEVKEGLYNEPGYQAKDNKNTDITISVIVNNMLNINQIGNYLCTYSVMDAFGFMATQSRVIVVRDTKKPVIVSRTGKDTVIHQIETSFDDLDYVKSVDNYWQDLVVTRVKNQINALSAGFYKLWYICIDGSGNVSDTFILTVHVTNVIPPTIQLLGSSKVFIPVHKPYNDPGATARDYKYESITPVSDLTSVLKLHVLGEYVITYTATDKFNNKASVTRSIHVIDDDAPVITLLGANPYSIPLGTDFSKIDKFRVVDNYDPEDSLTIHVDYTKIKNDQHGTYPVHYNATDRAGNKAAARLRYVNVDKNMQGIGDIPASGKVSIFPNPTKGVLTIEMKNGESVKAIYIYNLTGSLVKEIGSLEKHVTGSFEIDISQEREGIYLLRVEGSENRYSARINLIK